MSSIRKKFRGWVLPTDFIPDFHHVHQNRHSSFLGSIVGLRQPAHVVTKPTKERQLYLERIVYIGCIHGGNNDVYDRLKALIRYPPDYLIFAGDITGTAEIEQLKKHFYDEKEKNSKNPYIQFEYFGDWASILPAAKRKILLSGLQKNAERTLSIIQKIKELGTKIFLIEGNWDNSDISGIRVIAGNDIPDPFDTEDFFSKHGFQFINRLKTLQTKTTLHIFLPYITLLNFDNLPKLRIKRVQYDISKSREAGKTIIMVGHAEANWRIHNLSRRGSAASGERRKVIHNFGRAMALFHPDEVIYPHQHARIRDETGNLVDINAKYILQVAHNSVHLIDNPDSAKTDNKQIIATYVPLGFLAEEDFVGFSKK